MTTLRPARPEDVVAAAREHARVVPHGALSKKPLVAEDAAAVRLDMTDLSGVTEYNPAEYTFTARAGTPLQEIARLLAENGQHMPFDPPLADHGATIGGTVAAGVNGPGRLRYGGLRDFVIGVRFVDGTGRLVSGGGRVVKNAAGFDLPKLMVGSMGRLGVIVELTFKVFPSPRAWRTVRVSCRSFENAVATIAELGRQPLELEALELVPPATLMIRVAGADAAVDAHARRVGEAAGQRYEIMIGDVEADHWRAQRAFAWVDAGHRLIKVPLTPRRLVELERAIEHHAIPRRYGVAGNVAWLAWPVDRPLAQLDLVGLSGLVVRGPPLDGASPWLGARPQAGEPFARRVKDALDPQQRLPALA
ncbi:MAG: FAD-binding protein [Longimicrobiales bacterium]